FDDGTRLLPATPGPAIELSGDDLGYSAGGERADRMERTRTGVRSLPVALTLSYYDASRDYQTAQMRATIGEASGVHENSELAAVMSADFARALVEGELARRWAKRDLLTLRLPPRCIVIEPGSTVELASTPTLWTVEQCVIEAMVAVVQLRPAWSSVSAIAADPGRSVPSPDAVESAVTMAMFDLPDLGVEDSSSPALHLAAASPGGTWRPVPIEITAGGATSSGTSAARKSVLGSALTAIPPGQPHLLDLVNSVEVELVDGGQWLESRDDDALVMGSNLAALGSELIQFGTAVPMGVARFRLSRLLRGRRGTEWAMAAHAIGEPFALLQPGTLQRIGLMASLRGSVVEVRSTRPIDAGAPAVSGVAGGEALRPPAPAHLQAAQSPAGAITASWVRRSRDGWAWLDEIDAPLGEAQELYRVILEGPLASVEVETGATFVLFDAAQLAAVGTGSATLSVQQLGDLAASRPATLPIILS
ncbi:MAG: phage tail protein, partial [Sphingomicrobium sp.]